MLLRTLKKEETKVECRAFTEGQAAPGALSMGLGFAAGLAQLQAHPVLEASLP